ncbi:viral A-type inclusion protein, partial [Reticulomyxa filosa]
EELRKMNLKSNAEIEKLKERDNEKSKEIQQLKQCQSALEEILKSNNNEQCEQIAKLNDEIKQLKSEKELNEKKQNETTSKINNENLILRQQLNNLNIELEKFKKDIQSKNQTNEGRKENYYSQSPKMPEENKIQIIIQHWIRILHIKFGWINHFDKLVVNYVTFYFILVFHLI